jgi:hypothetical protein
MADQFENKQIDKRVVHRYIRKGIVDEKDYAQLQKSLPDLADQALSIDAVMEGEPDDEVDDET